VAKFEAIFRHLPEDVEENYDLSHESRFPGQDLEPVLPIRNNSDNYSTERLSIVIILYKTIIVNILRSDISSLRL
jgi:hypothetical protein